LYGCIQTAYGTFTHHTPSPFHALQGHFCPAIATAVKTMQKGEEVKLVVKPECEFWPALLCCSLFGLLI
jgi:hypothetical protein